MTLSPGLCHDTRVSYEYHEDAIKSSNIVRNWNIDAVVNEDFYVFRYFYQSTSTRDGGQLFHPRSVLIDMEPKVIAQSMQCAKQSGVWTYSNKQCFSQKSGSGNNWSYGYVVHGEKCDSSIEELVRCQVEHCDRYVDVVLFTHEYLYIS